MSGLIVFDVDGTILDSFGLFEKVVAEYSRDKGLPHPCLETIKFGYGDPHNHDFKWGVSREEQRAHLYAAFHMTDDWSLSGEAHKTPLLFAGVEDSLIELKDLGYTLGIVTSKPEPPLRHLLEWHNIGRLFSATRSQTDVRRRGEKEKPEPDQLQSVMRELSFAPAETVMVGDTSMDIRMGRSAATHTIGVTWGTHLRAHLEEAGAHHIVDKNFGDVTRCVRKIFEGL